MRKPRESVLKRGDGTGHTRRDKRWVRASRPERQGEIDEGRRRSQVSSRYRFAKVNDYIVRYGCQREHVQVVGPIPLGENQAIVRTFGVGFNALRVEEKRRSINETVEEC